ncbi:MAG TPA: bifunctional DNA-formamidopyrimidine glycosylase/DNA-(apurinic or apyrimidinic site) lyase [Syntrophobacteria bacterium]|nr:bifunctional DNA-formamidopyrimidine glycosylase/DNA-(apurinic or apyrimidinic site) lyase [Syntrophobacteria bacterium]
MPELPEVEVIRRGLASTLTGRQITRVVIQNRRLRLPLPRGRLKGWVEGREVTSVSRRAKYLLVTMESGARLVIHLGMSGRLAFVPAGAPRRDHDHVRFVLDDGLELRFNDARRFGSVQVVIPEGGEEAELFAGIGPEPFSRAFSAAYILARTRERKRPIKNFLMDGTVVAGIGNIYANEALFVAGIDPARPAGGLDQDDCRRLWRGCRQVLERAIACGGTTISDFVSSSGVAGSFQRELQVYAREGEGCRRCGSPIRRRVLAGRATYFCPVCQR